MQLSFRDPGGFVIRSESRVYRCVLPHAVDDLCSFLSSPLAATWMADQTLACSTILRDDAAAVVAPELGQTLPEGSAVVEHKRIRFTNYPYEWAPEMLRAAGLLTLRLADEAAAAGFGLKDATPYNVMFEGPKPIFIDLLSFERRDPRDPLWRPYAQLIRTFVYPLLAVRHFGLRLDELLLTHRDGLEPERMLRLCPAWRLLIPPFLGTVTFPALLSGGRAFSPDRFRHRRARTADEARFLLNQLLVRARRVLERATVPGAQDSYQSDRELSYRPAEFAAKERVVAGMLQQIDCGSLLDIGCNTGHFSMLAARLRMRVVAIDKSPESARALWRTAGDSNLDILPLVIDIGRPPGACGWANQECSSFLDRARGEFDCVLLLALIHHLLVAEGIPLDRICELAAELTTRWAILEYVDPADAQFQRLVRGRGSLYGDLTRTRFEATATRWFHIAESWDITPTRRIYLLDPKAV